MNYCFSAVETAIWQYLLTFSNLHASWKYLSFTNIFTANKENQPGCSFLVTFVNVWTVHLFASIESTYFGCIAYSFHCPLLQIVLVMNVFQHWYCRRCRTECLRSNRPSWSSPRTLQSCSSTNTILFRLLSKNTCLDMLRCVYILNIYIHI